MVFFLFLYLRSCVTWIIFFFFSGVRTVHTDGYPSDATGSIGDGPRVHVCHAQTSTDDNQRGRQGINSNVSEFTRSTGWLRVRRSADVRHRFRGDRTDVQHQRRGVESKAYGVRFAAYASANARYSRRASLYASRTDSFRSGRFAATRCILASVSEPAAATTSDIRAPTASPSFAYVAFASPTIV